MSPEETPVATVPSSSASWLSWRGRITRFQFWMRSLLLSVTMLGWMMFCVVLEFFATLLEISFPMEGLLYLGSLLTLPFSLALYASRLHDTGRSARWPAIAAAVYVFFTALLGMTVFWIPSGLLPWAPAALAPLVIYLLYYSIVAGFFRSEPRANAWGPAPAQTPP